MFGTDEFAEACVMKTIKENWYLLTVVESVTVFPLARWMILPCRFTLVEFNVEGKYYLVCVAVYCMMVTNFYKRHFLESLQSTTYEWRMRSIRCNIV